MAGKGSSAAALSPFQTPPSGTVKESVSVLTRRDVQRQSIHVRCQYRCIGSPSPKGSISISVGPVFQLESPDFSAEFSSFLVTL